MPVAVGTGRRGEWMIASPAAATSGGRVVPGPRSGRMKPASTLGGSVSSFR